MPSPVVQVDGARQLRRTLKQAGSDLDDLKTLHRKVSQMVADLAAARAPIGPTGRLQASIRAGATKTAGVVRAGSNAKSGARYAGPIHWGWPARGIKPRTFIVDAAQSSEAAWLAIYQQGLEDIIDKIEGA